MFSFVKTFELPRASLTIRFLEICASLPTGPRVEANTQPGKEPRFIIYTYNSVALCEPETAPFLAQNSLVFWFSEKH